MKTRFLTLNIIPAALLLLAIGRPAGAATVTFSQVSWGDGVGGYAHTNSQWGQVMVSFSSADASDLSSFGGGYAGFINILTSVPGGSISNWAVENMPVLFNSSDELSNGLPLTLYFDLGQPDGSIVTNLDYLLTLGGSVLLTKPVGTFGAASVSAVEIIAGTTTGTNNDGFSPDSPASNSIGAAPGTAPVPLVGSNGLIQCNPTNVAVVAEQVNGCAPGAAARSLGYLARMFPSLNLSQSAQQMYGSLTNLMQSDTGPNSSNGTTLLNFVSGKNAFIATNGLQIANTVTNTSFSAAISALKSTGDVEMSYYQGFSVTNMSGGSIETNDNGSHCVFIAKIIPMFKTNPPPTVLMGYTAWAIDDPQQGMNSVSNEMYPVTFDTNGTVVTGSNTNILGARLNNFRIEQATPH